MARVFLATTNEKARDGSWWTDHQRLVRSAQSSRSGVHRLVETADSADIVLFTDPLEIGSLDVRRSALAKAWPERTFVYSTDDYALPLVPGVYAGIERRWYAATRCRSGFYVKVMDHTLIQPASRGGGSDLLFSFCGAFDTHPFRRRIGALRHPNAIVRDTSADQGRKFGQSAEVYREWAAEYADIVARSAFVLCPRGVAPSSYRIFEAMKAGRVPVVLSDAWVPPDGPPWDEFCIRVAQKHLLRVPAILEKARRESAKMGERARQAWETWFSEPAAFDTIVSWCVQIKGARRVRQVRDRCLPCLQILTRPYFRHVLLRSARESLLGRRAAAR